MSRRSDRELSASISVETFPFDMSTVASHSSVFSSVDDCTVSQTPQPQAVSTALNLRYPPPLPNSKRLQELLSSAKHQQSMSSVIVEEQDSSFGLLPRHIIDFSRLSSDMPASDNSKFSINGKLQNLSVQNVENLVDDVFQDGVVGLKDIMKRRTSERQAGDGKEELLELRHNDNALENTNVEFCNDQISARSSTSDCYRRSSDDRASTISNQLFARLFQRHSLDISRFSVIASSPCGSFNDRSEVGSASAAVVETTKNNHFGAAGLRESSVPSDSGVDGDCGTENGSFVAAEDALELFKKDEEVLKLETAFLIPPQVDGDPGGALQQSWMAHLNCQDITRPSWFGSEDGRCSRISIGSFIRAKTEDLGVLGGMTTNLKSAPISGHVDSISVMNASGELFNTCDLVPDSIMDSMIRLGDEASSSFDPEVLMANLEKMIIEKTAKFTERVDNVQVASVNSTSTQVEQLKRKNIRSSSDEINWIALESVKQDENIQVSLTCSPPLPLPLQFPLSDNTLDCIDGDSNLRKMQPIKRITSESDMMFPVAPVSLHLLRESYGRRPSLAVQKYLEFSEVCAVGATLKQRLPIENTSTLWLEGRTDMLSLLCDGRPINHRDSNTYAHVFTFDATWTVEPEVQKHITVDFTPPSEGKWTAQFKISCRQPGSHEWHTVSLVSLKAVAEVPRIQINLGNILDFGCLPEESFCARSLQIVNQGRAKIDLRLIIDGAYQVGQGYFFGTTKETSDLNSQQVISTTEIVCTLYDKKEINVYVKAPSIASNEDPVQVLRKNLRVELNSPGSSITLATVLLRAIFGAVRLYMPLDVEPITIQPSYELPLHNRGLIPLHVELLTPHPDKVFINPSTLLLEPCQQMTVKLTYQNVRSSNIPLQSVLMIKIHPDGPRYEVHLIGIDNDRPTKEPFLKADASVLNFPTTKCKAMSSLKLTIRNTFNRDAKIDLIGPCAPFGVKSSTHTIKRKHRLSLPVYFQPKREGIFSSKMLLRMENQVDIVIDVSGESISN